MSDIPEAYQRVREHRVERIIKDRLSSVTPLSSWLFKRILPSVELVTIENAELHVDRDHRRDSGDPLAYGETDIEIIAAVRLSDKGAVKAAFLIETKVDARQTAQQGLRYRARANYRQKIGSWNLYQCLLVAPQSYLKGAYPLDDYADAGWDRLVAIEDIAQFLKLHFGTAAECIVLSQACDAANAWNKPIPEAAGFWNDLALFQRAVYPDVPIFIKRQQGAGISVWPSFFENQLANNPREIRRRRIQIVHSGKTHVALFVKNVKYNDFEPVVRPILERDIKMGAAGTSLQSVNIEVPYVNPQLSLEGQTDKLDEVFRAAKVLFDFFLKHETILLRIPTFKQA